MVDTNMFKFTKTIWIFNLNKTVYLTKFENYTFTFTELKLKFENYTFTKLYIDEHY